MEQDSLTKVIKKQDVTETFVDNDGMLVTRVIPKLIESDEPTPSKSTALKNKNSNSKPTPAIPSGQKSISSFFKKL